MSAPTIISAAAFLKRREPWLRHATRARLLDFIGWYWRDARVGIVCDGAKILAIALARCVDDVAEARRDPFLHRPEGRLVWVEHIASVHPLGIPLLLKQALDRFGPREAFSGEVFKRDGELRMLPLRYVERLADIALHGLTLHPGGTGRA